MRLVSMFLLVGLAGGCASSSSAVAVKGNGLQAALMAGRWDGTYEGVDSGRKGTLALDLVVGYRLAEGKVVMNAFGDPTKARTLGIQFVEVAERQVSGRMEPYTDPGCNCTVQTEFVGTVAGDAIDGTFTTRPVGSSVVQTGRWSATRKR